MVDSVSVIDPESAKALAEEYKNKSTSQEGGNHMSVQSEVHDGGYSYDGSTGEVTSNKLSSYSGSAIPADMIDVGGQVVKIEIAKSMGLIRSDGQGGYVPADQETAQVVQAKAHHDENQKTAQQQNDAITNAHQEAIDHFVADYPSEQRVEMLTEFEEHGDIEKAFEQVEDKSAVQKATEGYVLWADSVSVQAGLPDAQVMQELLTPEEAKQARVAVLQTDKQAFRHLSHVAVSRLENPSFNGDIIKALEANGVPCVSAQNGQQGVTVIIPDAGSMSLRTAVREGYLEFC